MAIFVTDSTVFIILGGNPNVEELVLSSLNDFGNLSPGEGQLLPRKIVMKELYANEVVGN